jgi:hypothetical protein
VIFTRPEAGRKSLAGSRGLTLVSHNAVGSKEFERGHFKQCWVEKKFSGCWSASRLRLQALLDELLEESKKLKQASGNSPPPHHHYHTHCVHLYSFQYT